MSQLIKKVNVILFSLFLGMSTSFSMPSSMCKDNLSKLPDSSITFFANESVNSLFRFNFLNYKEEITNQSEYLNEDSWKQYYGYLIRSGLLDETIWSKLIIDNFFKTPAKVLIDKNNFWQVQVPIFIVQYSAIAKHINEQSITLDISKNDDQNYNCGLRITKIQFETGSLWSQMVHEWFDSIIHKKIDRITYNKIDEKKLLSTTNDTQQPGMSDNSVLTAVNLWLLRQNNFDSSKLNGSIAILQKGLKNKYSWLLKSNNSKIIVIRDLKAINGLDVRME